MTRILSPGPYELAERMRERLKSDAIYPLALRWERFTSFLLIHSDPARGLKVDWTDHELDKLRGDASFS